MNFTKFARRLLGVHLGPDLGRLRGMPPAEPRRRCSAALSGDSYNIVSKKIPAGRPARRPTGFFVTIGRLARRPKLCQ